MNHQPMHPLSKMEKYKNLPLISDQELAQQQQNIMTIITTSDADSRNTLPALFNRSLAWLMAAAAVMALIIWRPWQDPPQNSLSATSADHSASISEPQPVEESAYISLKNEECKIQSEENTIVPVIQSSEKIEKLWSEITTEEMEIYLLEEEEF